MMLSTNDPHQKVRADHLKRDAYLYIRQSTLQQVLHNTEEYQTTVCAEATGGGAGLACGARDCHR